MRCLMCGEPIGTETFADLFRGEDVLCSACRGQWKRISHRFRFCGKNAFGLYEYNDAFSSCLIQFKELGDEALKDVFLYPDCARLKRMYHGRTLLLLPSAAEKLEARGFSHLWEMFESIGLPMLEPFVKRDTGDQKARTRRERKTMESGITLKAGVHLPKRVVLADDVITSGSTMKGALAVLPKDLDVQIFACAITPKLRPQSEGKRFLNAIINKDIII